MPRSWRPAVAALGACVVFAIGCSVVILHRHYPSGVVGGWLVCGRLVLFGGGGPRAVELMRSDRRAQVVE